MLGMVVISTGVMSTAYISMEWMVMALLAGNPNEFGFSTFAP